MLPGELSMIRDKLRVRHGVAIEEYKVIAVQAGNCLVENPGATKTFVLLPGMDGGELLTSGPCSKNLTG